MRDGPDEAPRPPLSRSAVRLTPSDSRWPERLEQLVDPPSALCCLGDPSLLSRRCVAIVGTRSPSASGCEIARRLGRDLAAEGFVVVSGMARGVDTAAHRGALGAGGGTIAVLGTGIDVCYPSSSRDVYERLPAEGLAISELDAGAPPLPFHFPMRNRLIAALAEAVVVVEGGKRSGSRITADLALDLGRDVMAVPRDPLGPNAETPNALLAAGATLVNGSHDVLAQLGAPSAEPGRPVPRLGVPPRLEWLAHALESAPLGLDEIVRITGRSVIEVLPGLLDLELRGLARRDGAGRYASSLEE